jgi:gamma-glutamylcyclotransferase
VSNDNKPGDNTPPENPASAIPLRWVKVSHKTPDHIAERYPYAGYGSNLNLAQMSARCATVDLVGPGLLRNARLVFAYHLGIVRDDNKTVPVGVYRMSAADVAAMDRYESLGRNYERILVTVEVNGAAVRCFTYLKRDNAPEPPSERYYQICLQGYHDWQFDDRRLRHARDFARKNHKPRARGWTQTYLPFDWSKYGQTGLNAWSRKPGEANGNTTTSYTDGDMEPLQSGTAASYVPRSGTRRTQYYDHDLRKMVPLPAGHRLRYDDLLKRYVPVPMFETMRPEDIRKAIPQAPRMEDKRLPIEDPTRTSTDDNTFSNPRTGERWRKGKNNVWYRIKE